jgi:hypothetical protein
MDDGGRAGRLRSFALGGIVGAAGAIATGRRLAQARRHGGPPRGLAAFEDAPCFLELAGDGAQRRREDAEAGASGRE